MKKVAVVILNWNGEKFLRQFLPGVVQHSEDLADIWVIDNASDDGSLSYLREHHPTVRWHRFEKNHGYARGYNLSMEYVSNEFVVLLNSDVEVTPGWIQPVIDYMADDQLAACQPSIMDFKERQTFEYAGAAGGFVDKDGYVFCAGRIFNAFEKDEGQYGPRQEVFWASGAALFVRRDAYIEVGGFDEDFYAHMEEIDLCWRMKNRGYRVGACRTSHVFHVGGGTLDRLSPFKTFLNFRNNLYLLVKNYQEGPLLLKMLKRQVLDGVAAVHFCTEGKFNYAFAVLKAHFSYYRHLRTCLRKRRLELKATRNRNICGLYNGSIVSDFFIRKKHRFSLLDKEKFNAR
ncbi:MAG: glycosyltransferase family 2 protein [Flavobacteriales bacterium]|nr:glycosyltransferase family 2 protein [Flavobacteriales bacterium]